MKSLNKENFFFFDKDCSLIEIYPNSLEHAYLAIIEKNLDAAEIVFSRLDSPRARWGKCLVSILKGYIEEFPTFFGIRNFLEIDLDFLLKNNLIDYVEQFLGSLDYLASVNMETYKFVARVMYENRLFTAAIKYMEQSKQKYYNDPELHFMLSKYHYNNHSYDKALLCINECLQLLPEYYPALVMREKIEQISI